MPEVVVFGISFGFPRLFRCEGQIAHVLLTRSPLVYPRRGLTARLACVKHAASVRPEPGSNSPLKSDDVRAHVGDTTVESLEYPGKSVLCVMDQRTCSYQRNRLTKQATANRARSADGALINSSSTFGTLLSSQGSCAHRGHGLPAGVGAL